MFAKLFTLASFALLAVATPTGPSPPTVSQCNTGSLQCCNSVQDVDLTTLGQLGSLIGLNVQGIAATIGLTCSGISVRDSFHGALCVSAEPLTFRRSALVVAVDATPAQYAAVVLALVRCVNNLSVLGHRLTLHTL